MRAQFSAALHMKSTNQLKGCRVRQDVIAPITRGLCIGEACCRFIVNAAEICPSTGLHLLDRVGAREVGVQIAYHQAWFGIWYHCELLVRGLNQELRAHRLVIVFFSSCPPIDICYGDGLSFADATADDLDAALLVLFSAFRRAAWNGV